MQDASSPQNSLQLPGHAAQATLWKSVRCRSTPSPLTTNHRIPTQPAYSFFTYSVIATLLKVLSNRMYGVAPTAYPSTEGTPQ
jgi:hypothetical protein